MSRFMIIGAIFLILFGFCSLLLVSNINTTQREANIPSEGGLEITSSQNQGLQSTDVNVGSYLQNSVKLEQIGSSQSSLQSNSSVDALLNSQTIK